MRKLTVAVIMAAGLVTAQPARALPIIDTGAPTAGSPSHLLWKSQWLAGEFNVSEIWTITDVQGWIDPVTSGSVRYRLYSDGGDVPGATLPLLERELSINGAGATGWYGPSGLNWVIAPGSYWLAFEVAAADPFFGGMPYSSPSPLDNEAFTTSGIYGTFDTLNIGVRVYANAGISVASVPDSTPTALLFLLGTGLIGAAIRLGRRPTA